MISTSNSNLPLEKAEDCLRRHATVPQCESEDEFQQQSWVLLPSGKSNKEWVNEMLRKTTFHVRRFGMTSRVAVLFLFLTLIPMIWTSWLIETGHLIPGKNLYFALPILGFILLVPLARLAAFHLINKDLLIINQFCREIKNGNYQVSFDLDNEGEDEDQFLVLLRNLSWMSHNLGKKQHEHQHRYYCVKEQYNAMEAQANTDALTRLFNRRHFDHMLPVVADKAAANNTLTSLIFIDCDKFKQVNDSLGHHMGDQVLIHLAESIRGALRTSSDLSFRLGGDEFAVILQDTGQEQAEKIAQRIRQMYKECTIGETTLSLGVATDRFTTDGCGAQITKLIQTADKQTYHAKKRGGDQVCCITCECQACQENEKR